jgi:SAM-dependent methyltransferase
MGRQPGKENPMSYDFDFYVEESRVARESAQVVLPRILAETGAKTVADVGCGTGAWAATAEELGCQVVGVDHGVPRELLLIDNFQDCDLNREGFACLNTDLAICLEVAEHLDPRVAAFLIHGLSFARAVLFSAATPGQPGVGHIHCRPHAYWHGLFRAEGFEWTHVGGWFDEPVADFYRRNMFLYREVS